MEWQPIDSVPDDGVFAVLYFPQHVTDFDGLDYRYSLATFRGGEWRDQGTNHYSFEVDEASHWMPLPPPPEEKTSGR